MGMGKAPWQETIKGFPNHLGSRSVEHRLSGVIEEQDVLRGVNQDNCIHRRLENRIEQRRILSRNEVFRVRQRRISVGHQFILAPHSEANARKSVLSTPSHRYGNDRTHRSVTSRLSPYSNE